MATVSKSQMLRLWDIVQVLKNFSIAQLSEKCGICYNTTRQYIYKLKKKGLIEVVRQRTIGKKNSFNEYRVCNSILGALLNGVRRSTQRQRIWRCIRIFAAANGLFQIADLQTATGIPYPTICAFLRILRMAGYVKSIAKDGNTQVFRLMRNTGGLVPLFKRKINGFVDPNCQEIFQLAQ